MKFSRPKIDKQDYLIDLYPANSPPNHSTFLASLVVMHLAVVR